VFDAITTWEPVEGGHFQGHVPDDWMQGRAAFGGLLAAGAVRLAQQAEPERPVRTLEARFFEPVAVGPFQARVETLRAGRSLAHVQVEVWQGERRCYRAVICLGADRPSDLLVPTTPAPESPEPDSLPAMPYIQGLTPAFTQHVDFRFIGALPFSGSQAASLDGWCRFSDGASGLAGVVGLIDTWPAPILTSATRPVPASTVHWTAHVLGDIDPDPHAWYRYQARTRSSAHGYTTFDAHLWTASGRLVSWSEQLTVVFDQR